ncbi:hypothetical protein AAVH_09894 [Aphelenchoides avenae]|nr:hypothetical protein AAVH_09894 [Aphelenchus avenae]
MRQTFLLASASSSSLIAIVCGVIALLLCNVGVTSAIKCLENIEDEGNQSQYVDKYHDVYCLGTKYCVSVKDSTRPTLQLSCDARMQCKEDGTRTKNGVEITCCSTDLCNYNDATSLRIAFGVPIISVLLSLLIR